MANFAEMLEVARTEALIGLGEGGVPVGAAIFGADGRLISSGRNRRVQEGDPSIHGETDAFRRAGRQKSYRDLVMVTTLAPCWYCSGLVRQFGFGTVVVGESVNFAGGVEWLREAGVKVVDLGSPECIEMMSGFIREQPSVWFEDIGV
jgi:creatinine deaminase